MQRLRTSCWVIVEPPSIASPASRSLTAARRMPCGSIAAVLIEALVLDRHGRLLEVARDEGDRDRSVGLFGGDDPELAAVGGVEGRVAASVDRLAGGQGGRLGGDVQYPGGDGDNRDRNHAGQDAMAKAISSFSRTPPRRR